MPSRRLRRPLLALSIVALGACSSFGSNPPDDAGANPTNDAGSPNDTSASDADAGACDGASCLRYVFVTSQRYDGNLGGLVGADAKCQSAANAGSLQVLRGRTFK